MTITIIEQDNGKQVLIGSTDKRFSETWGAVFRTSKQLLFDTMDNITSWANNELHEKCLFEIA